MSQATGSSKLLEENSVHIDQKAYFDTFQSLPTKRYAFFRSARERLQEGFDTSGQESLDLSFSLRKTSQMSTKKTSDKGAYRKRLTFYQKDFRLSL